MEIYKIAGLNLHVNEVEYCGIRFLERTVYDGDKIVANLKNLGSKYFVYTSHVTPPFDKDKSFDYPDDAVMALARYLRRLKVDLGNSREVEVRGVPEVPEFGDSFIKRILERVALFATSERFELELHVPNTGFCPDFPASVYLKFRSERDWIVRTNLGRPPESVDTFSKYVSLCERVRCLASEVRRSVEESILK